MIDQDTIPGVKLGGGALVCAGYQKSSVSLRRDQIFFALLLTLCELEDVTAFADDGDRGGLSPITGIELKWFS